MVTHRFIVEAAMFDTQEGVLTPAITTDNIPAEYNSNRYEFYCIDCLAQNHLCRMVPVEKETVRFSAPKRFRHYRYQHSTHRCEQDARYRGFDGFAYRYNAKRYSAHEYGFADRLPEKQTPVMVDGEIKTVDRASRLAGIAFHLMYDADLRAGQTLEIKGHRKDFRHAVFDFSKEDKLEIFRQAVAQTSAQQPFPTALIFQPNPFRPIWRDYAGSLCLPGTIGSVIKHEDGDGGIRPITLLWCENQRSFQYVQALANRDGTRASAPLLVMGDVTLSMEKLSRAKEESQRANRVDPVYVMVKVRRPDQVAAWDFDISFREAAANQTKVQETERSRVLGPRQRVLAL